MQTQAVLEVIACRAIERQLHVPRVDRYKLGLAVEGGGMRGIVSAAMLQALVDLHMIELFDCFVGVSAGNLNLAYTLANQGGLGLTIYLENMTSKEYLNLLRFNPHETSVLEMRRLFELLKGHKRLDIERLRTKYGHTFYISVANISTLKPELIPIAMAEGYYAELLMGGATIPFVGGKPWKVRESLYCDGGLFYIDPSQAAVDLGCTHVLVLNTRAQNAKLAGNSKFAINTAKALDYWQPGAGAHYSNALRNYRYMFAALPYGETFLGQTRIYRHALRDDSHVRRLTTDKKLLTQAMQNGYQSIIDILYPAGSVGLQPLLLS